MDALVAYRLACADAEYVRAEWLAAGSPLVVDHGNGASGVSPLWKCVGDADDRVARRARDLRAGARPRGRGRPVGATSAPDRLTLKRVD